MALPNIGEEFEYDGVAYVVCEKRPSEGSLDCFQKNACGNLRCDLQSETDCKCADPEQTIFACHGDHRDAPVCARFKFQTVLEWENECGPYPEFAAVFSYDWYGESWSACLWGNVKKMYEEERKHPARNFHDYFEPVVANPRFSRLPQWGEPGIPLLKRSQATTPEGGGR
jgi:hypothetical protein